MSHDKSAPIATAVSVAAGLLAVIQPALAHHAMGGTLPSSAAQGFLSGIAHPVIGVDHLAFILALGLLAAVQRAAGYLIPLAFVPATVAGAALHVAQVSLPFAELAVAISVLAAGLALFLQARDAKLWLSVFASFAGLFHGFAYAESIVGAETTPLFAYLAGFSLIQLAIAAGAWFAAGAMLKSAPASAARALRLTGTVVGLLGLGVMSNVAMA